MTNAHHDESQADQSPSSPKYGILKVAGEAKALLAAACAYLYLRLEAEHFFFGHAALEKSRELRELVQQLLQLGIKDEEINIVDIQAKLQNGVLLRGSKVVYRLKIEVVRLAGLGDALGAVTNQRGVVLERIEWGYDSDEIRLQLLQQAMQQAASRAQVMVAAVGHRLAGLRACSDSAQMPTPQQVWLDHSPEYSAKQMLTRQKAAPIELGTSLSQRLELSVSVQVEFWVTALVV
jgi:uncharacterized protein YggE